MKHLAVVVVAAAIIMSVIVGTEPEKDAVVEREKENVEIAMTWDCSGIEADLEGGLHEPAADEEGQTETGSEDRESVAPPYETGEDVEPVRDRVVLTEPTPETEGAAVPAEPQAWSQVSPVSQASEEMSKDWSGSPVYTVNGAMLPEYLQAYLYERMSQFGIAWFYRYALCQIYQESRFDPAAVSFDGKDHGLCQFRERFFADYATQAGLYTWDINNPIDQLYVYTWLMARNLSATNGDIGWALSMYYMGEAIYCERYVADVLQWESTMGVANGS